MSLLDFFEKANIGLTGKYGIKGYLLASRHTSYIFIFRSIVILLLAIIGFYFSANYNFGSNIHTPIAEITNYYLFIPSVILLLISTFFFIISVGALTLTKESFICPHCKKVILLINIQDFDCPICGEKKLNRFNFAYGCRSCHETIRYYKCPHNGCKIDLEAPYNEKELRRKRYEQ